MNSLKNNSLDFLLTFLSDHKNIFIHTDILRAVNFKFEKSSFLKNHFEFLFKNLKDSNLIFPSFNYDFLKNRVYDIESDIIEVGVLNEFIRLNYSKFRSSTPVFNFISIDKPIGFTDQNTSLVDPFDKSSIFHYLYESNSAYFHYGSNFSTTTLIHYAESMTTNLIYRYVKRFNGEVKFKDRESSVCLSYHVRPANLYQEYDWAKIQSDLNEHGFLFKFISGRTELIAFKVKTVVDFWLKALNTDPLYFLNDESRINVLKKINFENTKLKLNDFE